MKRTVIGILSTLALAPAASLAQSDPAYYAGFNNYQIQTNVVDVMNAAKTTSTISEGLWGAISKDPQAMCKQVGLGSNTTRRKWDSSQYDNGQASSSSNKSGGGSFLSFGASGQSTGGNSNSWDRGGSSSGGESNSTVVIGRDCSELVKGAVGMEINRMNSDTTRLGILVGNETQRYGIDKQYQVGIRQIEAGQIQTVFGGGARSMMGDMGR